MKTITLDGNHWFALKVFYNKVFEIEESLKKDDIDCYFPCEYAVVMRNGVRKIIRKPITNYQFNPVLSFYDIACDGDTEAIHGQGDPVYKR